MKKYDHKLLEKKWQDFWTENSIYKTDFSSEKPKKYILDMFPYPSGAGLHVGHPKGYIATDILSRMYRMQGFNVLHPMGWDAFGLPAEQFAIKNKLHPKIAVDQNIQTFKKQLSIIGLDYDWERELNTTDPQYYKWTQWAFLQMFKKGLVFESHEPINWCPSCKTGLANEDLEDGKCERCGSIVEKKPLRQWVIRITDYAERMLQDLDKLDKWPESVKISQKNWIGKSEGSLIEFKIPESEMVDVNIGPGEDAFQEGEKTVERDNVVVIIEHPDKEEFLCARWKQVDWQGFVTGGIEEGKTVEETALHEVIEETGYKNPMIVKVYDKSSYGVFWHVVKKQNRKANYRIVHVKLKDLEREEPVKEEQDIAEFVWVPKKDVSVFLKREDMKYPWRVVNEQDSIPVEVFTTRADTLFGVTYIVLAPENPLVLKLKDTIKNWDDVKSYIEETKKKSPLDRQKGEKTGIELKGVFAVNPANGEEVPVWIADYVLADYGTGAVMAVPAHDERDFEFAKKYNLPIIKVITNTLDQIPFLDKGILISSDNFDGLESEEAKQKITEFVGGKMKINYKLRDWVFSRQRYWGEPIPLVHVNGRAYSIPESDLPLRLPEVENYEPSDSGESPLVNISEWVNIRGYINEKDEFVVSETSPNGEEIILGRRETNTMPQWAGSCWYYLRYIDPKNSKDLIDSKLEKYWQPVDVYVGGMEHATRHLIYARFWHKFLFDIGVVGTEEPFIELHAPGLILAEDGRKMSKRWDNVINPNDMVDRFGADAFRLYEAFMGPFNDSIAWNTDGLVGTRRFIEKAVRISYNLVDVESEVVTRELHKLIKKVSLDLPAFKFNTSVSAMMTFMNLVEKEGGITQASFVLFVKVLAPFAPHVTDEFWADFGNKDSIHVSLWPSYDESKITEENVTIVIQVNGKVRGKIVVSHNASQEEIFDKVKDDEAISKYIEGNPKKVVYVQNKLISIVI